MWTTVVSSCVTLTVAIIGIYAGKYNPTHDSAKFLRRLRLSRPGFILLCLAILGFIVAVVAANRGAKSAERQREQAVLSDGRAKRLEIGIQEANTRAAQISQELANARIELASTRAELERATAEVAATRSDVEAVAMIQEAIQSQAAVEASLTESIDSIVKQLHASSTSWADTAEKLSRRDLTKEPEAAVVQCADTIVLFYNQVSELDAMAKDICESLDVGYMYSPQIPVDVQEIRALIINTRSTKSATVLVQGLVERCKYYEDLMSRSIKEAAREQVRKKIAEIIATIKERQVPSGQTPGK